MRELLFRVTIDDCKVDYFKGSGAGGQKKNKTSSGVRITHPPSGAVGKCTDTRSQRKNKETAWGRMCNSKEFAIWSKKKSSIMMGSVPEMDTNLNSDDIKVEVCKNGEWIKIEG